VPPKFNVGDKARVGNRNHQIPRWLKTRIGRVVTIQEIIGTKHGGHCVYRIAGRRGRFPALLRSDELRRLDEPLLRRGRNAPAALRKARAARKTTQRPRSWLGYSSAQRGSHDA
jgi:hypothetical protein